jgi:hypothetical protein
MKSVGGLALLICCSTNSSGTLLHPSITTPPLFFDPTAVDHKPHVNSIFRSDSITVAYQQAWKKTKSDTKRRQRKPTTVIGHIAFSKKLLEYILVETKHSLRGRLTN